MSARVFLYKLFAQSPRTSEATGFGREKGSREVKRFFSSEGTPKEWRSSPTLYGPPKRQGRPCYSVDTITGEVQKQIVDALQLGERTRASSLLSHIGYNKPNLISNNFVQLLEYCTLAPDPLFAMEIWRTMEEKGIDMNNECHALVILALCKGGYLEEAFNLMSNYGETPDLYPTLSKYNTLLRASAKMRSGTHAGKCLDLMERDMVGKNEETYCQLLKLAVFQKNLLAVHSIWKEYTRYYSFNLISLREFIWSFSKLGDIGAACEALRQLVALVEKNVDKQMLIPRLSVPIPFYNNFNSGFVNITSVYENRKEKSNGLLVKMILRLCFAHVIKACARARNHKLAKQLFFQMQDLGIRPSRAAYDGLIRVLCQTRGFHDGLKVLKLMQEKNLKPLDSTLAALSISCSKDLELDLAEAFLNQMAECERPYPYNALLRACDILDTPERGVHVFGKMKQLKVTPNIRTYELLFSLFGNVNAPYENGNILSQAEVSKRIHILEDDMTRNGIQHSYLSLRNLLYALGAEGMISRLLHYLRVAESQYPPRTPIYNIVLHSLIDAEEGDVAIKVFKTLMSHGYRPNGVTLNIMIDCCTITKSFKSAQGLIAMRIRYGYPPNSQTYTSLIKAVLALGDFDEALNLLNHACSEGIQIDSFLFNEILIEAAWKKRIDITEFVMDRMLKEKVRPDAATCGYVFSMYVDRGFYNTAMEALQVMSICMLSEQDINENTALFEDQFIYAEDSEAESRALEHFLDSEHHAIALLNLRWCAMQGNLISWSIHDSPWVKRLSATNRFR